MNNKKLKTTLLIFLLIILLLVSLLNIFQPNRKTVSEKENRTLEKFPEFSIETLLNGEYFSHIDNFLSDTFIKRDELLDLSEKIKRFMSLNTFVKSDDDIVYIAPKHIAENDDEIINFGNVEVATRSKAKVIILNRYGEEETLENETSEGTQISELENIANNNTNENDNVSNDAYEYMKGGYLYYNDIVYSMPGINIAGTANFKNLLDEFLLLYPNSKISVVTAPTSALLLENKKIQKSIMNQDEVINNVYDTFDPKINCVNPSQNLLKHKNEYLYFKYDHHWTQRGAYYAYETFANTVGLTPTPISDMKEVLNTKNWHGSIYKYTNDERLKDKTDDVYAYMPTKTNYMQYIRQDNKFMEATNCVGSSPIGYLSFIFGDNPYSVISVPENPQDKVALVIKDSYGNAFVPFLTENFGTIIIADPRYVQFNLYEQVKNYNITDIIFVHSFYKLSDAPFIKMIHNMMTR